jgi:hypothetical protein
VEFGVPRAIWPRGGEAVNSLEPEFRFERVKGNVVYLFQLSVDPEFKGKPKVEINSRDDADEFKFWVSRGPDNELGTEDDVFYVVVQPRVDLDSNTVYYWRVQAIFYDERNPKAEIGRSIWSSEVPDDRSVAVGASPTTGKAPSVGTGGKSFSFRISQAPSVPEAIHLSPVTQDEGTDEIFAHISASGNMLAYTTVGVKEKGAVEQVWGRLIQQTSGKYFVSERAQPLTQSVNNSRSRVGRLFGDGQRLAFLTNQFRGVWQVAVKALGAGFVQPITENDLDHNWVSVSADGELICYDEYDPDTKQTTIWLIDRASHQKLLVGVGMRPAISPDGRYIAFVKVEGDRSNIWVTQTQFGLPFPVTSAREYEFNDDPAWSPDSSRLAFSSSRAAPGNYDIWVADMKKGFTPFQVTTHLAPDRWPAWLPDGRTIVFSSKRKSGTGVSDYNIWMGVVPEEAWK